jgi:uncharacterized protein
MWNKLAYFILKFRLPLLIFTLGLAVLAGYYGSKVKLSYEFSKAIPEDHPAYVTYKKFTDKFGNDGNMMVIAIQTNKLYELPVFNDYRKLHNDLKKITAIDGVVSIPTVVGLDLFRELDFYPDSPAVKTYPIFADTIQTQAGLDSARKVFENEGVYKGLLYNKEAQVYSMALRINKAVLMSKAREGVMNEIETIANTFGKKHGIEMRYTGLPYIRTSTAVLLQKEMRWLFLFSFGLSTLMLLLFFRSISTTILSLLVVLAGVACSLFAMYVFGYQITILTVLLPPLIIVIGIPNCIYFINKYHTAWLQTNNKQQALHKMISSMGIVTLMCNITAAIGFAVFGFTKSALLKEFGIVSGIGILVIFFLSFILLPTILSYLPVPKKRELAYLNNKPIEKLLVWINNIVLRKPKLIVTIHIVITVLAAVGLLRLKQKAFIVDDLPKTHKITSDLRFYETHFKGIMPLEIVIESKNKKNSLKNPNKALPLLQKMDSLSNYLAAKPYVGKPLSVIEGVKYVMQAYGFGDTAMYNIPQSGADAVNVSPYFSFKKPANDSAKTDKNQGVNKLLASLVDSSLQTLRISVGLKDIGTEKLPFVMDTIEKQINAVFNDTANYKVTTTGSSITFNEGSRFIIAGLQESILWAFGLIAICMLLLFKSWRILICSLIPNVLPLIITAGVMGFAGVPLKPSTVLVFSVVLGIAIDITIRFLVNYKQQLPVHNNNVAETVHTTINETGISIIYTALVLVIGFGVFATSTFGGTFNLGWLTALTLIIATITNLLLLPVLLKKIMK